MVDRTKRSPEPSPKATLAQLLQQLDAVARDFDAKERSARVEHDGLMARAREARDRSLQQAATERTSVIDRSRQEREWVERYAQVRWEANLQWIASIEMETALHVAGDGGSFGSQEGHLPPVSDRLSVGQLKQEILLLRDAILRQ